MNKNTLFVSVESGKYKGKKIILPSLKTTRSTKSIVKQSVFNSIRYELDNSVFIEVFGGSASMAIEALSNNAKNAYAIEIDKNAYKILLKNAENFSDLYTFNENSFEFLPKLIDKISCENIILYLDPPFEIREGFENIYQNLIKMIKKLDFNKISKIIIEYHTKIIFDEQIGNFSLIKKKKFGNTSINIYENLNF